MTAPSLPPVRRAPPFYAAWSLAPLWMLLCSAVLAGAWLQPNHYHPWISFNSDAWLALIGLVASVFVFAKADARNVAGLHASVLGCLAFVFVLVMQRLTGLVESDGLVFINAAYVLGAALAMCAGQHSQCEPSSREPVLDTLFLGIGLAGFVSVVIQLHQWLQLPIHEFWVVEGGGDRPYANLGQPNQLATLLVWSLLAVLWGMVRGKLRVVVACSVAAVLATGLALTRSRVGMVELAMIIAAGWAWRGLWPKPRAVAAVLGVAALTCVLVLMAQPIVIHLISTAAVDGLGGGTRAVLDTASTNARLAIYEIYWNAAWERPWTGYGWNQLSLAQLEMAERFPARYSMATHAHNLFLDLAVGIGLPLAIAIFVGIGAWTVRSMLAVRAPQDAVLLLAVLALGIHGMLELPLHYGYFLWPAGLIVGVLNVRLGHRAFALLGGYKSVILLWVICAAAWGLVVRDYLLAEEEYRITRFEALNVGRTPPGPRPEMWVLTQLGDLVWLTRSKPSADMPSRDLDRMRRVVSMYPALSGLLKLAEALAVKGQPEEAAQWLRRLQKVVTPLDIRAAEMYWAERSAAVPAVAMIEWPR